MSSGPHRHAIVVGASIAGLVAARHLSDHADHVTIIERDHLDDHAGPRPHVPQGRHAHALLAGGQHLVDLLFPGMSGELRAAGAVPLDTAETIWHQAGARRRRSDLGFLAMSVSRPLFEATLRRRLLRDRPNVTLRDGSAVGALTVVDDRVVGVVVDGEQVRGQLVVDCSGRSTRLLAQLGDHGATLPATSEIRIDAAYATRTLRRRPGDIDGSAAMVIDDLAGSHRIGAMLPVEDERWIVTLASFHGDRPATDPASFERFARSLPSPVIADVVARTDALTPVVNHRMRTSRRRHVERLEQPPPGYVLLGDSICSFNPIYGQGMTSAVMQAHALGVAIGEAGFTAPLLPRTFYTRAAEIVDAPWRIAAVADFADPRTTGIKPRGAALTNRYLSQVLRACHTSMAVERQMTLVQNLLAPPESLLRPAMVLRVLAAAHRSPARRGRTTDLPPTGRGGGTPVPQRVLDRRPTSRQLAAAGARSTSG